jgi:acylphosphatase
MTDSSRNAKRFVISGRVQGVGFRYFVRQQALALRLAGWVRNLPDGRVEAFVEGSSSEIDSIEQRLREGPPGSHVEDLDISNAAPSLAADFKIRG